MCKAEELWKQVEAFRRQKMTQGEIDSAMMEYIGGLEKQRDELLSVLEGLTGDIQGLINESTGVVGLHLNGDIAHWRDLEAGGAFEWLTTLPAAHEAIAKAKGSAAT